MMAIETDFNKSLKLCNILFVILFDSQINILTGCSKFGSLW